MQKLPIESVRPGMVLAKTLYSERGDVLLSRGVTLTELYISGVVQHGYQFIWVQDGVADDVEPPEVLSPKLRNLANKHLHDIFSTMESICSVQDLGQQRELLINFARTARPQFAALCEDAEQIVENVAYAELLSGMVSLRNHDSYTYDHSLEVATAGVLLGHRLFLSPQEMYQLALGCLCHDIGKLIIPKAILNKPSNLFREELAIIRQHPEAGYTTAQHLMGASDIIARHIVRQHHERQDGTGYPRGLRGSNRFIAGKRAFGQGLILPVAEVAAVADVYCALAFDRPYRKAFPPDQIVTTLLSMAGKHLNREIVARFLTILPVYPIGTRVVVISSKLRGYRGIVTDVHPAHLARPTVRIVFDPQGKSVAPFEVDTSREREIEIATAPYARLAGFDSETAELMPGAWG